MALDGVQHGFLQYLVQMSSISIQVARYISFGCSAYTNCLSISLHLWVYYIYWYWFGKRHLPGINLAGHSVNLEGVLILRKYLYIGIPLGTDHIIFCTQCHSLNTSYCMKQHLNPHPAWFFAPFRIIIS
ncbi:hypothetical protein EDC01DRAFT_696003 [Geopyxis carbonaria]|nr:hypothetical protein EDC01DRAFT_696003 [Geopyxis carbonaria]